jgi:hypothetical protein
MRDAGGQQLSAPPARRGIGPPTGFAAVIGLTALSLAPPRAYVRGAQATAVR